MEEFSKFRKLTATQAGDHTCNRTSNVSKAATIAVIDDDAGMREATSGLLRSAGYCALVFGSAEEFLEATETHSASCVISDIRMQRIDGFALQARMVARGDDTPLILMTAFAENGARERALAAGAHGFLTKPYGEEALLDSVAAAVDKQHR
jgi:FixJ family two-component response regulator